MGEKKLEEWLEEARKYYYPDGEELFTKKDYRNLLYPFKKEQESEYLLLIC